MSGSRLLIVLLVLLAVLFAVGIGVGARNGAQPQPQAEDYRPDGAMKSLGGIFRPFRPRVKLDKQEFTLQPSQTLLVAIPAQNASMQTATVSLVQGAGVMVTFRSPAPSGDLNPQSLSLPEKRVPDEEGPPHASLVIPKEGGSLELTCQGPIGCQIRIE